MKGMTMKRFFLTIAALLMFSAFDAAALPKTQAKQVTVDPSSLEHSTNTTAQLVLEDLDEKISVPATTTTAGVVRFSTPAEVNAGTGTVSVISPADLKSKIYHYGMRYSGAVVRTGTVPSTWTSLSLSPAVGSNRVFAIIHISAASGPLNLVARTAGTTNDVAGAYNTGAGLMSGFADDRARASVGVVSDTNGVIDIKSITYAGATNSTLSVLCFQILGD
jgi:hypothetical protein